MAQIFLYKFFATSTFVCSNKSRRITFEKLLDSELEDFLESIVNYFENI